MRIVSSKNLKIVGSTNLLAKYKLLRQIGKGGQGTVFLAQQLGSPNKLYACKSVLAGKNADKEVMHMKVLRGCYGTTQLHEEIRDDSHTHLIMELCKSTLKDRIDSLGALSEEDAAPLFKDLVIAVGEMHKKDVLHRDLKCQNIFLTAHGHVKVGDFGLSEVCSSGCTINTTRWIGTERYLSPEATKGLYSSASDVWGLGIILYECLSGMIAFQGETSQEVSEKLEMGIDVAENLDWSRLSRPAKDFILGMLKVHPQERLTISKIVEHPWIAKNLKSSSNKRQETRQEK